MTDADTLRAVNTLVGVTQNEAMRQVRVIIMIIGWFTIVEAVVGESMLDAILLQVALTSRGTGTLQTTCSLTFGLLSQVAHFDQLEVAGAVLVGQHRHLHFWLDRLIRYDVEEVRTTLF